MTDDVIAALAARVERLEGIEAARGLFQAYAAALDTPHPEAVAALFVPDGTLTTAKGVVAGTEEIRAFFAGAFTRDPAVKRHFIVNPRATWLERGRVRLESHFFFVGQGAGSIVGWGTYDDIVDVGGPEPLFAAKNIDVHVSTTLAEGWATA
jgi:hypothetical protein